MSSGKKLPCCLVNCDLYMNVNNPAAVATDAHVTVREAQLSLTNRATLRII